MVSINLTEATSKAEIAEIIISKMDHNGIHKKEIMYGTHLSISAVNSVLCKGKKERDYRFETLLKVLKFMKIKLFMGRNEDVKNQVLSLF